MFGVERRYFVLPDLRGVYPRRGVERYKVESNRLFQRAVQDGVYVADARRLERGWGFKNLAGAAWLLMYWKLTADDEDSLCADPDCPYDRPVLQPNTRGRRKKYCSSECKKAHHYRTVTLPRRRATR